MEHQAILGVLGDSAFLVLAAFFAIGGLIVFRTLGTPPGSAEPATEPEPPQADR